MGSSNINSNFNFPFSESELKNEIKTALKSEVKDRGEVYQKIFSCIDLTSLDATDHEQKIKDLCKKALQNSGTTKVAAVCVYPVFAALVNKQLTGSGIKTACVAGAFPSGQSPINVKFAEVKYALEQGAEEIDMVISRGTFLAGDFDTVFHEIETVKAICQNAKLKVILETGELQTPENIYTASNIAISAGADFIKTSTGKISVGATLDAFWVMLQAIRKHYEETGKMVGIKASGGISEPEQALQYWQLTQAVLGEKWVNNQWFRIGASRLVDKLM